MTERCSNNDLLVRVVALEASLVSYKEFMEERDKRYSLRANTQDNAVTIAMDGAKAALNKADAAIEKRLEGLNELKGMAENQSRTFARDAEVKLSEQALSKRIEDIADTVRDRNAHGSGVKDAWGYFVVGAGLMLTALAIYFKH